MTERAISGETQKQDNFFIIAVSSDATIIKTLSLSEAEMKSAYAGLGEDYLDGYGEEKPSPVPYRLLKRELEQTEKMGLELPARLKGFMAELSDFKGFFLITRNQSPESLDRTALEKSQKFIADYYLSLAL